MLIIKREVASKIDQVALQTIELGLIVIHEEEREVLRHEQPFVGRALEIDEEVVVIGVDRERGYRKAARADRHLKAATDQ